MAINRFHAFSGGLSFHVDYIEEEIINSGIDLGQFRSVIKSFQENSIIGKNCRFGIGAWCANRNQGGKTCIQIGDGTICRGIVSCENFGHTKLTIGSEVYIGDDTLISCAEHITIADHVLIAHGVQIFDNDTHPIMPSDRIRDWMLILGKEKGVRTNISTAPVTISERVWVGFNSIIMKGITIGKNSIVAAGSVVIRDVPPNVIVAGNPASIIKHIEQTESQLYAKHDKEIKGELFQRINQIPKEIDNSVCQTAELVKNLPIPNFDKHPLPENKSTCYISSGKGSDSYHPLQMNSATIRNAVTNSDILRKVISVLNKIEPDDYVKYTIEYYRSGLKNFGNNWHYADITTALLGISQMIKPKSYLEIGVRRGRSMAMVASQSPECQIVGFDIWKQNYAGMPNPGPEFVRNEILKFDYKGKLELINGNSHETVKKYFKEMPDIYFDLITVDGDHTREGAAEDIADVLPRLKIGGVVIFDDIIHPQHKYLHDVWKHYINEDNRFVSWEFDALGYGVAVAARKF